MPYGETKVYFDGSHYIAIPHTTRPTKRRLKPLEEKIVVVSFFFVLVFAFMLSVCQ